MGTGGVTVGPPVAAGASSKLNSTRGSKLITHMSSNTGPWKGAAHFATAGTGGITQPVVTREGGILGGGSSSGPDSLCPHSLVRGVRLLLCASALIKRLQQQEEPVRETR